MRGTDAVGVVTDKATAGRRARRRGLKYEDSVAEYIGGKKTPGSGMYKGYAGDVEWRGLRVQCKRTSALKTQRGWLEHDNSDILFQAEPGERTENSLVVMRASTFRRLVGEGE